MVDHHSFGGDINSKVSHFLDEYGNWKMELLQDILDTNLLNHVIATPKSIEEHTKDEPIWGNASNSKFSIASAFSSVTTISMHSIPIESL